MSHRVLGARSIIADPRREEMKNIVNELQTSNLDVQYKLMEGKANKIICKLIDKS